MSKCHLRSLLRCLEGSRRQPRALALTTHVGNKMQFCLLPGPTLDVVSIWGVDQQVEELSLSLWLAFQINNLGGRGEVLKY